MARPKKNNLDYFPHENNMRSDKKLLAVRNKFDNMVGYGLYNAMLEALAEEEMLQIEHSEEQLEVLCGDFRITIELLRSFLDYTTSKSIDLFQIVDGYIRCSQLEKRGEFVFEKRGRTLPNLRVSVTETGVSAPETRVSVTESTQRKEKKRKEKESKEIKTFVCPEHLIDLWPTYMEARRIKKAVSTERALQGIIDELEKFAPNDLPEQHAILKKSIDSGWLGVFMPNSPLVKKPNNYQPKQKEFKPSADFEEACIAMEQDKNDKSQIRPQDMQEDVSGIFEGLNGKFGI